MRSSALLVIALGTVAACRTPPPQPAAPTIPPVAPPPEPATPAPAADSLPARTNFAVGELPSSLVVVDDTLVWTDSAGAIWAHSIAEASRSSGDAPAPVQLTEQHRDGFMFHPVLAGGRVLVSTKHDFAAVTLPRGPVTPLGLALDEVPESVVADTTAIYTTLFKRDEVLAIPLAGGAPQSLMSFRRGVLAVHDNTLYAVSYATGALVSVPTGGGKVTPIARGFPRATALAVDDAAAYIYSEKDRTLRRLDLATRALSVLATDLENADDLVSDGPWLYTYSWPSTLMRIAKDGSGRDVLATDLASPSDIAVDARAVYVVSRDQRRIVRLAKQP